MRRRQLLAAAVAALVAVAGCSSSDRDRASGARATVPATSTAPSSTPSSTPTCAGGGVADRRVETYLEVEGAPADLTTLEVIRPQLDPGCGPTPVMVWVHGGGWSVGDRRNGLDDKVELFSSLGWTLVSVNYRLSPDVQYPVHNDDVAAALDWVFDHAGELGLDPTRVSVMGHSAGAGISAGVVADQDHLGALGRSPGALRCAVLLDTEGYDVVAQARSGNRLYLQAFGDDPAVWAAASPILQLTAGEPLPDTLVVTRGTASRRSTAEAFVTALRDSGAYAELIDARPLTHAQVNAAVGAADDQVVTPQLTRFLQRC